MIPKTISILDDLIRAKSKKKNRSMTLLKAPDAKVSNGWYMYVPPCFNESLDIRRTERVIAKKKELVWTQGSWFSFKRGDTLYDTPKAYQVWSEALKYIGLCLQIKAASNVEIFKDNRERFSGSVTFLILIPDKNRIKIIERNEHTMSQDDFVRFLIAGPIGDLKAKIETIINEDRYPNLQYYKSDNRNNGISKSLF
ncbi:MAG: hypothetical protein EHM20_12405 [Alphaproteobacteria bacterium]|nr:MAG: hypothetical protein EHM20_12405 [Alphaproteobacteria bacterium]